MLRLEMFGDFLLKHVYQGKNLIKQNFPKFKSL